MNNITAEVQILRTTLVALRTNFNSLLNEEGVPTTSSNNAPTVVLTDGNLSQITGNDVIIVSEIEGRQYPKTNNVDPESSLEKALQLFQGLLEVLVVHFGIYPPRNHSFHTLIKWWNLASQDKLESYYKTQSAYLFSLVTRQGDIIGEMPEIPSWLVDKPGFIIGGEFWRRSKHAILHGCSNKEIGGFYAIMNVKRAGLAISEMKQSEALATHMKNMHGAAYKPIAVQALSAEIKHPMRCVPMETEEVLSDILVKFEQLLVHDFRGRKCDSKWRVPSVNACFEHKRDEGGSHPLFIAPDHKERCRNPKEFIGFAQYKDKHERVFVPYRPDKLYSELMASTIPDPEATVHKVLEPFKARIITAGPGRTYQGGRCVQKPVHNVMRENPMFRLTGEEASLEYVKDIYQGYRLSPPDVDCVRNRDERTFIVAADFTNATDAMRPEISRSFGKILRIHGFLNENEFRFVDACMKNHLLHYPGLTWAMVDHFGLHDLVVNGAERDQKGSYPKTKQSSGQLMGSPLSFPILCYANAAGLWVSAEYYYGRSLSYSEFIRNFRPIFNGDDASFLSNPIHYQIWRRVCSVSGLNSSLGKSYCTRQFVMINSELFATDVDETGLISNLSDVFVLNPGLIKGQAKVMSDTRKPKDHIHLDDLLPLCDQLEKVIRKCDMLERILCKKLFLEHVVDRMKKTNRPWDVPRCLGGLGLRDVGSPNYSQRMVTAWLLMQADAKQKVTVPKTSALKHIVEVNRWQRNLEERLDCKYNNFAMESEDEVLFRSHCLSVKENLLYGTEIQDFSLDECFLGDGVEEFRKRQDGYSKLMTEVLKRNKYVSPVSDDKINDLYDLVYTPRKLDEKILFF